MTMVPLHAAVFIRITIILPIPTQIHLPFHEKNKKKNEFFLALSRVSFFSFRQGPFVAMLIPKAHKIAVYSKLFNGEVSFCGCVSRCNHVQFFFSQLPSGFGLQYFSQTRHPSTWLLHWGGDAALGLILKTWIVDWKPGN